MSKFFIPKENILTDNLIITGEDVKHINKVLRMGIGDEIICCDGQGNDYKARISSVGAEISCKIIEKTKCDTESNIHVILIQGVPKASKMDYIIEKTTELGICEIYPCDMSRCVSKIDGDKKIQRWQKVSEAAAKQSGRGIIPKVHSPINISEAVEILKSCDVAFVPYECAEDRFLKPLLTSFNNPKTVAFIIGPEGGFDKSEIEKLKDIPVISLGKRILRTETAGEAVLSMVMYELGDINGNM